jgi:hypothetical protein
MWLAAALMALLWATSAKAASGVIVRTTLGLQGLEALCLVHNCTVVLTPLDGALGQLFLLTTPDATGLLSFLKGVPGIVDAELDQLLSLVGGLNAVPTPIPGTLMSDRTLVPLPNSGTTTLVWNSYVNQPASGIVKVQNAQNQFNAAGTGIVADIDTGVDPTHPALVRVLLPGYDFTRNKPGASELNDLPPSFPPPSPCTSTTCPAPAQVNQSTAAVLDQSTAAVLDGNAQYAAFGHGTMVMGVIHLVAPKAHLLPLKAFRSDGTGLLSNILRAIYYAVQNNANAINMSFDTQTYSQELKNALDYAEPLNVIGVASAGNDGQGPPLLVYPAALQHDVMGVASTSDADRRSSFSNYGNLIVWVAAPGEAIVTTYPFSTYAAGWGTSFSAPFVSGGAALLRSLKNTVDESQAAAAVAHAVTLVDPGMGNGRLDLVMALTALQPGSSSPDFAVSAAPSSATVTAGQGVNFTVSAVPVGGFNQTVTWSCTGAPAEATCEVSPPAVQLDGSNPATATVLLTTTARAMSPVVRQRRFAPLLQLGKLLALCFAWLVVLLMLCSLRRTFRQKPGLAAAAVILAVSLCAYSCGGGYGSSPVSPTLSSLSVNPGSVTGGSSSTGTVTLSGPAPSGGAAIYLTSGASAAQVPASLTVAAGGLSASFTVSTSAVTASTPLTVSASYAGLTRAASLTVTPASAPGTPAGTYTLTVTGTSGNLSQSNTVQVTVN